jgi:hypothetical protein
MATIRNDATLRAEMEKAAREALEGATKEILEVFKKEYVLKYAYISNPKKYERTMEFLNSWEWEDIKKAFKSLSTVMFYNPDLMHTFDPDRFIHGSKYSSPPDVRDNLMDILNKKGFSSSLWLSVYRDTPYWDKFIQDMFKGGLLDRILTKHFSKVGFRKV